MLFRLPLGHVHIHSTFATLIERLQMYVCICVHMNRHACILGEGIGIVGIINNFITNKKNARRKRLGFHGVILPHRNTTNNYP